MQRMQHEPIAAQGHDHIGLGLGDLTKAQAKHLECCLCGGRIAGDKGDLPGHAVAVLFPKGGVMARIEP